MTPEFLNNALLNIKRMFKERTKDMDCLGTSTVFWLCKYNKQ